MSCPQSHGSASIQSWFFFASLSHCQKFSVDVVGIDDDRVRVTYWLPLFGSRKYMYPFGGFCGYFAYAFVCVSLPWILSFGKYIQYNRHERIDEWNIKSNSFVCSNYSVVFDYFSPCLSSLEPCHSSLSLTLQIHFYVCTLKIYRQKIWTTVRSCVFFFSSLLFFLFHTPKSAVCYCASVWCRSGHTAVANLCESRHVYVCVAFFSLLYTYQQIGHSLANSMCCVCISFLRFSSRRVCVCVVTCVHHTLGIFYFQFETTAIQCGCWNRLHVYSAYVFSLSLSLPLYRSLCVFQ